MDRDLELLTDWFNFLTVKVQIGSSGYSTKLLRLFYHSTLSAERLHEIELKVWRKHRSSEDHTWGSVLERKRLRYDRIVGPWLLDGV